MTTVQEIEIYRQKMKDLRLFLKKEREEKRQQKLETMYEISKLHIDEGIPYSEIARRRGVSRQRIYQLMAEFEATGDTIEEEHNKGGSDEKIDTVTS